MTEKTTSLQTDNPRLNALLPRSKGFLDQDVSEANALGTPVRGYHSPDGPSLWLRDHTDMMRGFRYWEHDMTSMVGHFAETQTRRGWLFDYFTLTPDKLPCERENWAKYVRVPVEADVEYRFVNGVYLAWQATGDDAWMNQMLPHAERALQYVLTDPWRWDRPSQYPFTRPGSRDRAPDSLAYLVQGASVGQLNPSHQQRPLVKVEMRVDQTRQYSAAGQVDGWGAAIPQGQDLVVLAYSQDTIAPQGQRRRLGELGILSM